MNTYKIGSVVYVIVWGIHSIRLSYNKEIKYNDKYYGKDLFDTKEDALKKAIKDLKDSIINI